MSVPFLSICVPSRNRQRYFQETIRALLASPRDDIEYVLVDNSDDGEVMRAFMQPLAGDPRVRFLPAAEHTLSMMDNWERAMAASSGRWVAFIGDDDFIDPDVATLIAMIEKAAPTTQGVAWNRLTYHWPGTRRGRLATAVPTGCRVIDIPRHEIMRKTFGWQDAGRVPTFMFSYYHAAARRDLIEANRGRYGGRYFEYPLVDQESAFKTICNADRLVFSERPFSVLGACAESNSAAIGRVADNTRRHAEFMSDLGRNMDEDPLHADFPFPTILGVTAAAGLAQHWFRRAYGLKFDGWEENFARSCALDCSGAATLEDFELMRDGYAEGFARWQGGKFRSAFAPSYAVASASSAPGQPFTGITPLLVHLEEYAADARTPAELYALAEGMMTPPDEIPVQLV